MRDFLKTVWSDVQERKNIELYLILIVTVAVFAADVLGVETRSAIIELVLVALAVLLYNAIDNRHFYEYFERKLGDIEKSTEENRKLILRSREIRAADFFLSQHRHSRETFSTAETIYIAGVTLTRTLLEYRDILHQRLKAGAHIRIAIVDPMVESALQEIVIREAGSDSVEDIRKRQQSVENIIAKDIVSVSGHKGLLEIGYLPYVPYFNLVLIDPDDKTRGICYVSMYHHQKTKPSLKFEVRATEDTESDSNNETKYYDFFRSQYKILWDSCHRNKSFYPE